MTKIHPISYDSYEKLVDDVYYIGSNIILRMNVSLAKKLDDGRRYFYHSEFMYNTNKYIDTNKIITMRRSFDYYLTIENIKEPFEGEKQSIMIRPQDMLHIRRKLHMTYRWFTDDEFKELYAYSKDKLVMLGKVNPIVIEGFPLNKKIIIEPIVIDYDNITYEGVRFYLNDLSNYADITSDKLAGLIYLMDCINMYESAQLLLNYHGRPPYGDYMIQFNDNNYNSTYTEGFAKTPTNRQIPGEKKQRQKSFFDKIDDM